MSKILILTGLLTTTVLKWWLGYEWLDVIGYSLIFVGLLFSKKTFIESNSDYGIHIFYTVMVIFIILVFEKWFL